MRLHLGCGRKRFAGFINVDLPDYKPPPDVGADLRKLPFENDYADEVWAIHVIEHFYAWEVGEVLTEWKRVLKPGGLLVLEMPDLAKVKQWLLKEDAPISMTMWPLYGDPRYKKAEEVHKWCYDAPMMESLLKQVGFTDIVAKPAQYHQVTRDFRVEAKK